MPTARRRAPASPTGATLSAPWQRLTRRLAEALELLEEGHFLILAVRDRHRFVQFAGAGDDGIRAECVSNHYLAKGDRLTAAHHRALEQLGWLPPSRRPVGTKSFGPEDGSPNWLRVFPQPVDATAAAMLAVRTFREVYDVRQIGALQYEAFEADGGKVYFPGLPTPREVDPPPEEQAGDSETVAEALLAVLQYACDDDGVAEREPSQWRLAVDGIHLFVVLDESQLLARIVAPLLPAAKLEGDPLEVVNDINAERLAYGYVYLRDGQLRYATEVLLEPFHPGHVVTALQLAASAVQGILMDLLGDEIGALDASDDLADPVDLDGPRDAAPDPRNN